MGPPRRATRHEFERRETLDVSLRLSWTPINAAKREAGCASAIRRHQQTDGCGSVGREQKIDTINVPFYLPARGPTHERQRRRAADALACCQGRAPISVLHLPGADGRGRQRREAGLAPAG